MIDNRLLTKRAQGRDISGLRAYEQEEKAIEAQRGKTG